MHAHEAPVRNLQHTVACFTRNEATTTTTSSTTSAELSEQANAMLGQWRSLRAKLEAKQALLAARLREAHTIDCELQDVAQWLATVEAKLAVGSGSTSSSNNNTTSGSGKQGGAPVAGLPDTAKEQLARFMAGVYNEIEANEARITGMFARAIARSQQQQQQQQQHQHQENKDHQHQPSEAVQALRARWLHVKQRASERRDRLLDALRHATDFDANMRRFCVWLTDRERELAAVRAVSRLLDTLKQQIDEHQRMQRAISEQRELVLALDKLGTHIKYSAQAQDCVVVKNRLLNAQNRWEKLLNRSAERTRELERGFADAKRLQDVCGELLAWLGNAAVALTHEATLAVANNPLKIKQLMAKHREMQRAFAGKHAAYETSVRLAKRQLDKCEPGDRGELQRLLADLKSKWTQVSALVAERQKRLEDALLCSGQLRDALSALVDWLTRVEPTLAESGQRLNGDLETVLALIEDNEQFRKQLALKAEQVAMAKRAVLEISTVSSSSSSSGQEQSSSLSVSTVSSSLLTSDNENQHMQQQQQQQDSNLNALVEQMTSAWSRVEALSVQRTERLSDALALATEFNAQVRARVEWLSHGEQQLSAPSKLDIALTAAACENNNHAELLELIESHQAFERDLAEQAPLVEQCSALGHSLLDSCMPEAAANLKHWLAVLATRWNDVNKLSDAKRTHLETALRTCEENESATTELLAWLHAAEATLTALDHHNGTNNNNNNKTTTTAQLANTLGMENIEQMLRDHLDFEAEMHARQQVLERITAAAAAQGSQQQQQHHDQHSIARNKKAPSVRALNKIGLQQQQQQQQSNGSGSQTPKTQVRSSRVRVLVDRWRRVSTLAMDRRRRLRDALEHLQELERLKNFDFDEWRRRYMAWNKDNRSRITDFFRRNVRDHQNGKIARGDFIQGILASRKCLPLFGICL